MSFLVRENVLVFFCHLQSANHCVFGLGTMLADPHLGASSLGINLRPWTSFGSPVRIRFLLVFSFWFSQTSLSSLQQSSTLGPYEFDLFLLSVHSRSDLIREKTFYDFGKSLDILSSTMPFNFVPSTFRKTPCSRRDSRWVSNDIWLLPNQSEFRFNQFNQKPIFHN